jgi:hypothetical protein
MPHSTKLRDCRLVLDWANQHRARLRAELAEWAAAQGREPNWDIEKSFHPGVQCFVVSVSRVDALLEHWALIVGDVLSNLRAPLDYLAQELIRIGSDPSPKNPERTGFPICDTEAKFNNALPRKLPGVDPMHIGIVRRYQPFRRGSLFATHPLCVLRDHVNGHKHNKPRAAAGQQYGTFRFDVIDTKNFNLSHVEPSARLPESPIFEVGTEIARVYGTPTGMGAPGITVVLKGGLGIAFDDGSWVVDSLQQIHSMVSAVLDEFEPIL